MTRDEIIAKLKETAPALYAEGGKRHVPHTSADLLQHAVDSINNIQMLLSGTTAAALATNKILRMAVERYLEMISDASRYIPDRVKALMPEIDWSRMGDLGERLRKDYHLIDGDLLFQIAARDLPPLKAFAERVIRESGQ